MIVKLTAVRYAHMMRSIDDAEIAQALTVEVEEVAPNRRGVAIDAPYAAWLYAREAMKDRAFNDRGYRRKGVPRSLQLGLVAITQACGFVERHPALRGCSVFGHAPLYFPVWRQEPDRVGRIFNPYPRPGGEFVVLKPVWEYQRGERVTTWGPDGVAPSSGLLLEETHQRLWRERLAVLT